MKIGRKEVGLDKPVYFIADIASNHDGSLERAKQLIRLAAESGTDAVKFQNFRADSLISDYGFKQLGGKSHQSAWKDSVYETYKRCETPLDWTPHLASAADSCGIDYLTTPYDIHMLPDLAPYTSAWKLGSGDITYKQLVMALVEYKKPLLMATGASVDGEIARALSWTNFSPNVILMQCNTNYTGHPRNINYVNLRVLASWWGGGLIGFSDHTQGHAAVLGAVALAARVVEKHFTDDNTRNGPDHSFAMNPVTWSTMVARTRELEAALGDGIKKVEDNECETVVLQRRAIRAAHDIKKGEMIKECCLVYLRPCPKDALAPYRVGEVIGKRAKQDIAQGDVVSPDCLSSILH